MLLYPEDKISKKVFNPKFGKGVKEDLNYFIQLCEARQPNFDRERIEKAFYWNVKANKNRRRKSGEEFYTHALEVAKIIINEIEYDDVMVSAALMHNILSNPEGFTVEDVQCEFGETTAKILEGVDKITQLERLPYENEEYLRRIILSLLTDVRILLIKIAGRLHDVQTIGFLDRQRQMQLAESTMAIYVPFAHRMGLGSIKGELEDLAFRVLEPENYHFVQKELNKNRKQYEQTLHFLSRIIINKLKESKILIENNIAFEVHGRVKHIYSTFKKSILRKKPINELYDIIAFRIILDHEDESLCYEIKDLIKSLGFKEVQNTYKDYIKNPKPNGYKSLHLSFYASDKDMFEIQIRTRAMHDIAERGIASHYQYKNDLISIDSILNNAEIDNWISSIKEKMKKIGELSFKELLVGFPYSNVFNNIYVFTPKNEIKILQPESTALDFAYYIHTDVGNHTIGVKVNGKSQSLDFLLNSGDKVEIITSDQAEPDPQWLSIVRTTKAINAIKSYFKSKEKNTIKQEKKNLISFLRKHHIQLSLKKFEIILRKIFPNDDISKFYLSLRSSNELKNTLDGALKELAQYRDILKLDFLNLINQNIALKKFYDLFNNMRLTDHNYKIEICNNCFPIPTDDALCLINENNVIIHRATCNKILITENKLNTFKLDWRFLNFDHYTILTKITGETTQQVIEGIKTLLGINAPNSTNLLTNVYMEKVNVLQRENPEFSHPFIILVHFKIKRSDLDYFLKIISDNKIRGVRIERL